MDDQLTSLQQLLDAVISMWTKISALLNLCKEESRWFWSQKTLKLYLIKRSVSVWTDQIFFSSTTCLRLFIVLSNIWQQTTLLTIQYLNVSFFKPNNKILFHVSTALSCLSKLYTHNFGYMEPGYVLSALCNFLTLFKTRLAFSHVEIYTN